MLNLQLVASCCLETHIQSLHAMGKRAEGDEIHACFGIGNDVVPALPTAFMKPLSGGGARGMMIDAMKTFGADSFAGRLSSMFQGATDTTFYIIAVYFGSVGIKKTRHALTCALISDAVGIISAIAIAYMFFPPN